MMLLADCVTLFTDEARWSNEQKTEMLRYVASLAEVAEIRAVAYHDIAALNSVDASAAVEGGSLEGLSSNLYCAWYLTQNKNSQGSVETPSSLALSAVRKSNFIDFIEDHCKKRLIDLKVKENHYFNSS